MNIPEVNANPIQSGNRFLKIGSEVVLKNNPESKVGRKTKIIRYGMVGGSPGYWLECEPNVWRPESMVGELTEENKYHAAIIDQLDIIKASLFMIWDQIEEIQLCCQHISSKCWSVQKLGVETLDVIIFETTMLLEASQNIFKRNDCTKEEKLGAAAATSFLAARAINKVAVDWKDSIERGNYEESKGRYL